jgi:hypothetical protein
MMIFLIVFVNNCTKRSNNSLSDDTRLWSVLQVHFQLASMYDRALQDRVIREDYL